jgi:hypothetical protein
MGNFPTGRKPAPAERLDLRAFWITAGPRHVRAALPHAATGAPTYHPLSGDSAPSDLVCLQSAFDALLLSAAAC